MRFGASSSPERPRGETTELVGADGSAWTVVMPPKGAGSGFSGPAPKARLVPADGSETLQVPVAVARAVIKAVGEDDSLALGGQGMAGLVASVSTSCCAKRLTSMVDRRDYSVKEAKGKLLRIGFAPDVVEDVCSRAQDGRLLDDSRFAETFIRSKAYAGWGQRRIERELSRRGIDAASVNGWPEEFFDGASEFDRAWELVSRRSVPAKNPYEKTVRFLVGRGYSYDVAKRCASQLLESDDA
ncbi:regulatory protein RecX [Atopobiaceae bacterium 24-176]